MLTTIPFVMIGTTEERFQNLEKTSTESHPKVQRMCMCTSIMSITAHEIMSLEWHIFILPVSQKKLIKEDGNFVLPLHTLLSLTKASLLARLSEKLLGHCTKRQDFDQAL